MSNEVEKFINNVEEYWLEIQKGTSKGANAKQRANKKLVDKWTKDGHVIGKLFPLLEHSSNAVKLSAAACLINTDAKEKCIEVLKYIVETDPTLVASSAGAVLRFNKIA
jgi:hypothetical protein